MPLCELKFTNHYVQPVRLFLCVHGGGACEGVGVCEEVCGQRVRMCEVCVGGV